MVFDDLVLLATGAQEKGLFKKKGEKMKVIDEGIGEVIDVKDWSGWGGTCSFITIADNRLYNVDCPDHTSTTSLAH